MHIEAGRTSQFQHKKSYLLSTDFLNKHNIQNQQQNVFRMCSQQRFTNCGNFFFFRYIILGLPHVLFYPGLSRSSNQKFLSGWVFHFIKNVWVFYYLLLQKAFGYFNGAKIQKILLLFKEIHNYKTELSLSEPSNGIMNSEVNL